MADDPEDGEVEDERSLELETVAAIYPELHISSDLSEVAATLEIGVAPTEPLLIRFPAAEEGPSRGLPTPPDSLEAGKGHDHGPIPAIGPSDAHSLEHLPPLVLRISLPQGYPSKKPPIFELGSEHSWLPESKLEELREMGLALWEDLGRDQVVFSYIDQLREMAERGFGLAQADVWSLPFSADLKVVLLDFDLKARQKRFENETFDCGICLEPKKGSACHRLLCSHVFCVACLQDFYNSCINEGDIGNVKCIAPGCEAAKKALPREQVGLDQSLQEDGTLEPSELLQIPIQQDLVQRYIKLKRKKRLESDRTTIYCPRQWCQGPARCPNKKILDQGIKPDSAKGGGEEPKKYDRNTDPNRLPPPAERLAICEDCTFAFCNVCKASWHGEYFVCFPRSQFELTAEERASEDYMMLHTQPCPTCDARAQKTHGCNHMICFKCDTHFCYLCGAYLDKGNPYQHYNAKTSSCYMRLWELEGGDDGEFGQAFAGGRAGLPLDSDDDEDDEDAVPVVPHPQPAAIPQDEAPGIQRFLRLVQDDEEDEWDSDELEDDDLGARWD